jgi:hypothetical protein
MARIMWEEVKCDVCGATHRIDRFAGRRLGEEPAPGWFTCFVDVSSGGGNAMMELAFCPDHGKELRTAFAAANERRLSPESPSGHPVAGGKVGHGG